MNKHRLLITMLFVFYVWGAGVLTLQQQQIFVCCGGFEYNDYGERTDIDDHVKEFQELRTGWNIPCAPPSEEPWCVAT